MLSVTGRGWGCTSASCCSWARSLSNFNSSSTHANSSSHSQQSGGLRPSVWGLLGVAAAAGGVAFSSSAVADARTKELKAAAAASKPAAQAALQQQLKGSDGLPVFTAEEVAQHRTPKDRVWVTYKDGVYDVTDFVAQHPGGAAKIMLAAGGSVEPFWGLYQQHMKQEVRDILAQYRIGSLKGGAAAVAPTEDPYRNEPRRHPALIVRSDKPFNGETPAELLVASPVTPNDMFFVRHHLPVPVIDNDKFTVTVEGAGMRSLQLSVQQLQQNFKKAQVAATVQCTGNRRTEMKAAPAPGGSGAQIKGLDWEVGAISNAEWGGVLLRDVLLAAGLQPGDASVQHIHLIGLDTDMTGTPYAASIPIDKALSEAGDVLLAWEMNGQPIPADHGGPLRVVVPGTTGARSVKWIGRIVASADECQGHWQQKDYKAFSPGTDWDAIDWSAAPAIQEMPVVSAICEPAEGAELSTYDGEVTIKGYAWSGGGRDIIRVDVSADGGKTWSPAKLSKHPHSRPSRAWAWTLYEATLPLPEGFKGQLQLACKATDQSYNTQPEDVSSIWNIRGLVNNAWHKVNVSVVE
uniref:Sulfite oxidase n=1 Tax=Tetradesmus obliquus TaxID=3088 RepID=A0A383VKU0_TETOB|eukprot:jgi/Sobl393_1/1424/SZX66155.1